MRWFRLRARSGSWIALSALILQLVLTFGHVHLDRAAPPALAGAAVESAGHAPTMPDAPDGLAADYCAVCAVIHLAGSLLPTHAPALPLLIAFEHAAFPAAVSQEPTTSKFTLLQARAPPIT